MNEYEDFNDITSIRRSQSRAMVDAIDMEEMSPEEPGGMATYFSSILAYLPFVDVTEKNNVIKVSGIPTSVLTHYIYKYWNTSKISKYIFLDLASRYFTFHSFYATEVIYILKTIRDQTAIPNRYKSVIDNIVSKMFSETHLRKMEDYSPLEVDESYKKRFNVTLLPKQEEFIHHYADLIPRSSLKGMLVHADPGTGKTLKGLAWGMAFKCDTLIVVGPKKSIGDVWVKHAKERFNKVPKYFDSITQGELSRDTEFCFVHYDYMPKFMEQIKVLKGRRIGVWLDESHNYNELKTTRVKLFTKMCNELEPFGVVWASGTPLKAIGKETIPLIRSIDDLFTEDVEKSYLKVFGTSSDHALDILNNRMKVLTFRVMKAEVMKNEVEEYSVPVKIPNPAPYLLDTVKVEIRQFVEERFRYYNENMKYYEDRFEYFMSKYDSGTDDFKRYRRLCEEFHRRFNPQEHRLDIVWVNEFERDKLIPKMFNEDKKEFRKIISVFKYVELTIRGEALGRILTKRRIECFREMVDHFDFKHEIDKAVKKTIIFTSYVSVVDAIYDKLKKEGYDPIRIYGATNNELQKHLDRFRSDYNANPIIATYDSLSDAVTLTEASTCILFNSPFRDYIRNQATARLDRFGQDSVVTIVMPKLNTGKQKNLSTRSFDIQEWSKQTVDAILGGDYVEIRQ